MDLHAVSEIIARPERTTLSEWREGDAWLGGGTWLFSEPQPALRRLIDLRGFGWTPIERVGDGLSIAATCTIAELFAHPLSKEWPAARALVPPCCDALLGSFKIWGEATVGGNLCLALPAAPMAGLAAALDGVCVIWTPDGGERTVPAVDFIIGDGRTVLSPGEALRRIDLPAEPMKGRAVFRRASLSPRGRSAALLIGLVAPDGGFTLTITAATLRPIQLTFGALPSPTALRDAIESRVAAGLHFDDPHGSAAWRRRLTVHLAEEIRAELNS